MNYPNLCVWVLLPSYIKICIHFISRLYEANGAKTNACTDKRVSARNYCSSVEMSGSFISYLLLACSSLMLGMQLLHVQVARCGKSNNIQCLHTENLEPLVYVQLTQVDPPISCLYSWACSSHLSQCTKNYPKTVLLHSIQPVTKTPSGEPVFASDSEAPAEYWGPQFAFSREDNLTSLWVGNQSQNSL